MDDVRIGLFQAKNGIMLWLHDATTDHVLQFNSIDGIDPSQLSPKDHQALAKLTNSTSKIWTHSDADGIEEDALGEGIRNTYSVEGFGEVTTYKAWRESDEVIRNAKVRLPGMPEGRYLHIQDFDSHSPEYGPEYSYTRDDITKRILSYEPDAPAQAGRFEVRIDPDSLGGDAVLEIRDNTNDEKISLFEDKTFIDHDQVPEKADVYMVFRDNLRAGRFQASSEHRNPDSIPKGMDPENYSFTGVERRLPGFGSIIIKDYDGTQIGDPSAKMTGQSAELFVNGMEPGTYINIPDTHNGLFYKLPVVQEGASQKLSVSGIYPVDIPRPVQEKSSGLFDDATQVTVSLSPYEMRYLNAGIEEGAFQNLEEGIQIAVQSAVIQAESRGAYKVPRKSDTRSR